MLDKDCVAQWRKYNRAFTKISQSLGGTNNIVGEFAEQLACLYYGGEKAPASRQSYDLTSEDGKKVQVKSRRMKKLGSTNLNVIRSWAFDILAVIVFSEAGSILKAVELDSKAAKSIATYNEHQNGWIIATNANLFEDKRVKEITAEMEKTLAVAAQG